MICDLKNNHFDQCSIFPQSIVYNMCSSSCIYMEWWERSGYSNASCKRVIPWCWSLHFSDWSLQLVGFSSFRSNTCWGLSFDSGTIYTVAMVTLEKLCRQMSFSLGKKPDANHLTSTLWTSIFFLLCPRTFKLSPVSCHQPNPEILLCSGAIFSFWFRKWVLLQVVGSLLVTKFSKAFTQWHSFSLSFCENKNPFVDTSLPAPLNSSGKHRLFFSFQKQRPMQLEKILQSMGYE